MRLLTVLPAVVSVAILGFVDASLSQDYAVQASSMEFSSSTSSSPQYSSQQASSSQSWTDSGSISSSDNQIVSELPSQQIELKNRRNNLAPFTTDGCSMWIDGTPNQPWLWRHCCVAHDRDYWIGGTAMERRASDQRLHKCVMDIAGKFMGGYMYTFVIPGGSPYWLTPYRWGYGWSYLEEGKWRGYKSLSDDELAQANALIPDAEKTITEDAIQHPADFKIPERHD